MQGEDKGLIEFQGKALIEYALAALKPLTEQLIINANRNQSRYATYGYPVVADSTADFAGPLAGILTVLATRNLPLLISPCDAPFISSACFERLRDIFNNGNACAVAHDGQRLQPMFLALAPDCRQSLQNYFNKGERKLGEGILRLEPAIVDCSDHPEWFRNANSPAELAAFRQPKPL